MSSYITRYCDKHGEWEQDVDRPLEECSRCEEEGIAPSQLREKELATLRAENERLQKQLRLISPRAATLSAVHGALIDAGCTVGELGRCEAKLVRELAARVEELTATLQKMADGPCWFDGDENVEWDADERCSEEACFRCVAQHALADALTKVEKK